VTAQAVADAVEQLKEYFSGSRRTFKVQLAASPATDFQHDVWGALRKIPTGSPHLREVANAVIAHARTRAVGKRESRPTRADRVPCHRVVSSDGLGGYGGGDDVKRYPARSRRRALRLNSSISPTLEQRALIRLSDGRALSGREPLLKRFSAKRTPLPGS